MKSLRSDKGDRSIVDRAWELQHNMEARQRRIGKGKYGRVLKMARKPTDEEFAKTSKITGAGILIVGGLGFVVVWLLAKHVAPWIGEIFGWI